VTRIASVSAELSGMDDGVMAHPQAPSLAALAALLAHETRATFCLALLDGRAWTASELPRTAQVSRPTATEHLNRLVEGGLLTEVRQGRHRYLKLADDRTGHLIEELTAHAPAAPDEGGAALRDHLRVDPADLTINAGALGERPAPNRTRQPSSARPAASP
jgi:DNA-binding transcriptional ArsR family regulator